MGALKQEIVNWLEAGATTRVDAFTDQAIAIELMRGLGYIGGKDEDAEENEEAEEASQSTEVDAGPSPK